MRLSTRVVFLRHAPLPDSGLILSRSEGPHGHFHGNDHRWVDFQGRDCSWGRYPCNRWAYRCRQELRKDSLYCAKYLLLWCWGLPGCGLILGWLPVLLTLGTVAGVDV